MNRTVFIMLKALVLEHSQLQLLEHSHTYVVECLAKLSQKSRMIGIINYYYY